MSTYTRYPAATSGVDLTSNQTIAGTKTFSSTVVSPNGYTNATAGQGLGFSSSSTTVSTGNDSGAVYLGSNSGTWFAKFILTGMQFAAGTGPSILWGAGAPAVAAPVGSLYLRTDGGASTSLYVKESGAGTTGWVAK